MPKLRGYSHLIIHTIQYHTNKVLQVGLNNLNGKNEIYQRSVRGVCPQVQVEDSGKTVIKE